MQFGDDAIRRLREALETVVRQDLFREPEFYPDNWRASVRKPQNAAALVLHRGGFPDGA